MSGGSLSGGPVDGGVVGAGDAPPYGPSLGTPNGTPSGAPDGPDAEERDAAAWIERALRADAPGFAFFQTMRLLARLRPDRAPVGEWADPREEVVRFSVPPTLGFPTSEVRALDLPDADDERPAEMEVAFYGLTGPQGALPHVYTTHAADRARMRDTAFRDFLDLFHHRALSLFYRAWERGHPEGGGADDRVRAHLLDIAGFGTSALQSRFRDLDDDALAYYAGLLGHGARPADGLAQLVADYFGVPVTIEQFVGEWRSLAGGGQLTLGVDGADARLGSTIVGDAYWDPQAKVRLRLGPLARADFDSFLPGGVRHRALVTLARLYADAQVGVDAQLVLAADAVPVCALGAADVGRAPIGKAPTGAPVALGLGTWLGTKPRARDADDVTLALC